MRACVLCVCARTYKAKPAAAVYTVMQTQTSWDACAPSRHSSVGAPGDRTGAPQRAAYASWMMVYHLNMNSMAFASPAIARSPLIQEQCD